MSDYKALIEETEQWLADDCNQSPATRYPSIRRLLVALKATIARAEEREAHEAVLASLLAIAEGDLEEMRKAASLTGTAGEIVKAIEKLWGGQEGG